MPETIFLSDDNVLVTSQAVKLGGTTYSTNALKFVQLVTKLPDRFPMYALWSRLLTYCLVVLSLLLFLGVLSGFWNNSIGRIGSLSLTWVGLLIALLLFGVVLVSILRAYALGVLKRESMLAIKLVGDFGEVDAFTSTDHEYVRKIVNAIKLASNTIDDNMAKSL
jgi:hypothetical protein